MTDSIGLYIHIPFCRKKCAYCDFYSAVTTEEMIDGYLGALYTEIERWGGRICHPIDTVYIGGGTPSVLGNRIVPLLEMVYRSFRVLPNAEITVEMNPTDDTVFLEAAKSVGVNRLSIGLQSGLDRELSVLGRTHTAETACRTVEAARKTGFDNLSVDLMLGLPDSTLDTLGQSIDFALSFAPEHLSAYLLKLEPNTRLYAGRNTYNLPDDDAQAEQYLYLCDRLREKGYRHYEISNFARPGRESRHNTKYWTGVPYLGIGPAAHSFLDGKRFYYPRDLKAFLSDPKTVSDGTGGGTQERLMLGLRLADGVDFSDRPELASYLQQLCSAGLGRTQNGRFALTDRGMLVSNSVITELLERIS